MTHARGTDQFAVVQPDAVSDEEFVEETTELQLDGGVDTESETSEQLADDPAPAQSRGSMNKAWRRLLRFLGSGDDHEKGAVQYEQARNRLLQFFGRARQARRRGARRRDI